jgi:hypothetical protein
MNHRFNDAFPENGIQSEANYQDFDWKQLYQNLDEQAHEAKLDREPSEVVARLLMILVPPGTKRLKLDKLGLRVIALAWVLSPSYFEGSPSLRQLARRCRISPQVLAHFTSYYSRLIRWRNPGQQQSWKGRKSEHHTHG